MTSTAERKKVEHEWLDVFKQLRTDDVDITKIQTLSEKLLNFDIHGITGEDDFAFPLPKYPSHSRRWDAYAKLEDFDKDVEGAINFGKSGIPPRLLLEGPRRRPRKQDSFDARIGFPLGPPEKQPLRELSADKRKKKRDEEEKVKNKEKRRTDEDKRRNDEEIKEAKRLEKKLMAAEEEKRRNAEEKAKRREEEERRAAHKREQRQLEHERSKINNPPREEWERQRAQGLQAEEKRLEKQRGDKNEKKDRKDKERRHSRDEGKHEEKREEKAKLPAGHARRTRALPVAPDSREKAPRPSEPTRRDTSGYI